MVVFSITCPVVFALHEVSALEGSRWIRFPRRAMMRWIQFVFLTASLVSLFIIRPPRAQRKVIRALDEFASGASGRGYGRADSSTNEEATGNLQKGDR